MNTPIIHIYSSRPPYLKKGDKVGVVCTAGAFPAEKLPAGIALLKKWGLKPVVGKTLELQHHYYAGTDEERTADLQTMLDDKSIRAILCARGGYGTHRLLDNLDFTNFQSSPKWVIGFSDITALHCHIYNHTHLETIHAVMPTVFDMSSESAFDSLHDALFGNEIKYNIPTHSLNRMGDAKGELIGGNLSVLYGLIGSSSEPNFKDKVLFIEDLTEYLYHLDRMMVNLKRAGKLENLAALIVGGMTNMLNNDTPFGKTSEEIIWEAVEGYDYPVCFDFPAGHIPENNALIMGRKVHLNIHENGVYLEL